MLVSNPNSIMKGQNTTNDAYSSFLNKLVKVVYKEYNAVQIGKGLLVEIHPDLIILKGDISRQGIPRSSVIKISELFNHEARHDGSRPK